MTMTETASLSMLPPRKRWTRAEYECAIAQGVFAPGERLELVEGEIVEKMPQNPPHELGIMLVGEALKPCVGKGYILRIQLSLATGEKSYVEPDIAVIEGSPRDFRTGRPETALLVVEISDTTLAYDRGIKSGLYARAGVRDYWILNLTDRTLEVHRDPAPMSGEEIGFGYRTLTVLDETSTVSIQIGTLHTISVRDLLP